MFMPFFSFFIDLFKEYTLYLTWRDILEIFALTYAFYFFIRWLAIDTQKNLIGYFYGYWALLGATYYLQLSTLTPLLLISLPLGIIMLCVLHQHTLQKNFITLKKITVKPTPKAYWVVELVRACVQALHKQKDVVCIIQKNDSLLDFLKIPSFFNSDVTTDLLDMLLSTCPQNPSIFLIDQNGQLISFNVEITVSLESLQIPEEEKPLSFLHYQIAFLSTKTDAFIFKSSARTHFFECYLQGTMIEHLTSSQLISFLEKYIYPQGNSYETFFTRSDFTQQEHR
jgi:hypothetical protein